VTRVLGRVIAEGGRSGRRRHSREVLRWALAVILLLLVAACSRQQRVPSQEVRPAPEQDFGFAVIGDLPYTSQQRRQFPAVVDQINADPGVDFVFHVGDIREVGACSTRYYRWVKSQFDRFSDPLVYTFGDNDWADCSKLHNGQYDPLERLSTLRAVFIPKAGYTSGQPVPVSSQAKEGLPENVIFERDRVAFGVFHAVGSRNDLAAWTGSMTATDTQRADTLHRVSRADELIEETFERAHRNNDRAVVLLTHADMFAGTSTAEADLAPYRPLVRTLARNAAGFSGPVYLINGDSHEYRESQPLAKDSRWPATYGVPAVDNFTRITVDGADNATDYLRVTIEPYYVPVLEWTRIPLREDNSR
jgi:hypothetical protein